MIRNFTILTTLLLSAGIAAAQPIPARPPVAQPLREIQRAPGQDSLVYELRTYFASAGKLDELHARFQNHMLRFHERHGIANVGYWVPTDNPKRSIVSLVSYPNMEARDKAWSQLLTDREWVAVRRDSEANGRILDAVCEEILTADEAINAVTLASASSRGFEIRRYSAKSGKLDEVKALVRERIKTSYGTSETVIRFFTPTDHGNRTDTTLLALVTLPKVEDANFVATRTNLIGPIVAAIPGEIMTRLKATEYSPVK